MIGLNTRIRTDTRVLSFSIPVEKVKNFLQKYDAGQTLDTSQDAIAKQPPLKLALNGAKVNDKLTHNSSVNCEDGSFYNTYTVEGKLGQSVMIYMESPAFAPYLTLLGPDGKQVATDENTPNDNWAMIRQQLPANGIYKVIANSRLGKVEGAYTLSVSPLILLRQGELSLGNGTLKDGSFYQSYTFQGTANQEVSISTFTPTFAPYLLLVNSDGKVIAETKNVKPGDKEARIKIRLPRSGDYKVIVSTLQPGSQGGFNLVVR
jgi:serine protease Do